MDCKIPRKQMNKMALVNPYISMTVLIVNILNSSIKRYRMTRFKLFLSLLTKFYSLRNTFCRAIAAIVIPLMNLVQLKNLWKELYKLS